MKGSVFKSGLAGLLVAAGSVLAHEQCQCRTTVIVVEMPEQYTSLEIASTSVASSVESVETSVEAIETSVEYVEKASFVTKLVEASSSTTAKRPVQTEPAYKPPVHKKPPIDQAPPKNTTHTFKPCSAPKVDRKDPKNFVPAKNVSLAYAPAEDDE